MTAPGFPSAPVQYTSVEYDFPGRYTVGKTGEHEETRLVLVPDYAWECEKCPTRGEGYELLREALQAVQHHQFSAHPPTENEHDGGAS